MLWREDNRHIHSTRFRFLDILEPYDTVMADCGFKIKSDLTFHRCFLAIPPSAAKGNQMTSSDIRETSKVAMSGYLLKKLLLESNGLKF